MLLMFVAVPVMAHQLDPEVNPHVSADPTTGTDPGTEHALVESITISGGDYLTAPKTLTATITFADGVAAIPDDPDTTSGDTQNEARHAILSNPATDLGTGDIDVDLGTLGEDGEYDWADVTGTTGPRILSVAKTTPEGSGATGSGSVYTVFIAVPTDLTTAIDGKYRIGVTNAAGVFNAEADRPMFTMDTRKPTVTSVSTRPIGQNYANVNGEWSHPFEITFNLDDPDDNADTTSEDDNFASGLDLTSIMFETDVNDELTFGSVSSLGNNQYVVTATPVVGTADKAEANVAITIKVRDKAGNEGKSTDPDPADETVPPPNRTPLTVTLTARTGTGGDPDPDPTDSTPPTVVSVTEPTTPIAAGQPNAGSLVFTITFSEALQDGTFTLDDLVITNVDSSSHSTLVKDTTDPKVYKLTVTPGDTTFPVKVSFDSSATVTDTAGNPSAAGIDKTATYTPKGVLGVDIEVPDKPTNGALVFTFKFAQAPLPATDANGRGFTISDVTVSNAETLEETNLRKSATDDTIYYLTVIPRNPRMAVTVTLHSDAVVADPTPDADPDDENSVIAGQVSATFTPDTTAPTLVITHTPADSTAVVSGGMVTFTFTFTDQNTIEVSGAGAFTTEDVTVVGGTKGTFTATNNKTYTLTVTPTTPNTNVIVTVTAGSVSDTAIPSNALAANVSETWMAPTRIIPPDTTDRTPPTLEITHTPADGVRLPESGHVTFTFTFSESLSTSATAGFTSGDVTIVDGSHVNFYGSGAVYTYIVAPNDPTRPVGVRVEAGDHVQDPSGNALAVGARATYEPIDNTAPTVEITSALGTGTNAGKVVFTFDFDEELGTGPAAFTLDDVDRTNSNVLFGAEPVKNASDPTVYTLVVAPGVGVDLETDTIVIVLKTLSVADRANNYLVNDQVGTYKKAPITPESDKPVVTITGPSYIDSISGGMVTITATDNTAVTNAVMDAEITVTGATKGNISNNQIKVMPNTGATSVTVSVAAGAARDAANNGSDAKSMTFSVGPIFTIPANTILVITKTAGMTYTYVSDQPRLPVNQQPPTPAPNIQTAVWANMPDLEVLFSFAGGSNGGTLNLTEAHGQAELPQTRDGNKNQRNSVRISEVMWAVDLSLRGSRNDAEAAEQWIEVTNDTGGPVSIFLFARTGLDSAINVDDVEDRIGNAYNGSPGSAGWNVPGQNGNSWTGVDFVSMHRSYVTGDNRGYVNGTSSGHWHASDREYLTAAATGPTRKLYNYKGSPGRPHTIGLPRPNTKAGVTQVPSSPVIINEVANRSDSDREYEWIELRNVTGNEVNLRNWMISVVRGVNDDKPLVQFPNNDNAKIAPNGVILLLASDPRYDDDHPIAVGYNVDVNANDQVDGLGLNNPDSNRQPPRQKVITFENGGLPDSGDYVLILRKHDNYEGHRSGQHGGKGVAETGGADIDKIIDIAGHHEGLNAGFNVDGDLHRAKGYPATNPVRLNNTTLWPLVNFNNDMKPHRGHGDWNHRRHNRLDVNRVRYRQHVNTRAKNDHDGGTPGNRAGTGVTHKNEDVGHYAFRDAIYTGLGYKRTARAPSIYNGTPGYDGNSVGNTGVVKATAADADVTISEIMYSTGPNPDNPILPQWIELYNSSPTNAVNLRNWKLRFETLDADGDPRDSLMDLNFNNSRSVKTIQPQQTVLIVAGNAKQANSDSATGIDVFNENRVFNVYRDIGAGKFGANTRYMFFNPTAFNISVVDKDNKVVDSVGNLDGDARTSDTANWDIPMGIAADSNRTSIIRVYDDGVARAGVNTAESNVMPIFKEGGNRNDTDGIDAKYSWIPAVNTEREFKVTIKSTWYGDEDDYGTPNHRVGLVLPVELSFFRPTLEDGVVTIRWTTESELDNAGFNIYRSETRDGAYKQVNTELIEGAGTTGERSVYSWVDSTAKPGVVYYYQIEDVSFAGDRQALAVTKLKGLISAKNKLTTTWSELKEASQ